MDIRSHKSLLYTFSSVFFLYLSWWWSTTYYFWVFLDDTVFHVLNGSLVSSPRWALFWAYMNADLMDRVMEVLIFCSTFYGIHEVKKRIGKSYWREFFIYYLTFTLTTLCIKKLIYTGLDIHRYSPSLVFTDAFRLTSLVSYKIKDASKNSFPPDHALFLLLMWQYARYRFSNIGIYRSGFIALFFCLPRLISGGHWLTDLIFGGLLPSIVFANIFLSHSLSNKKHLWK